MTSTSIAPAGWLLLLYSLPTKKASSRVNLWRKLKKTGAYTLKTSAYVLPDAPVHFERFQWLVQQVRDDGGEATLARVTEIEGLSNEDLAGAFNELRAKDYQSFSDELQAFIEANRKTVSDRFADALEKLRKQFNEIRAIDFFECPAAKGVEALLDRARRLAEPRRKSLPALDAQSFQRRTWLTRPRPEIDRVGSAWLIRNFIDPHATFVFAPQASAHPEAIPYDMLDVEFTHHGDDCTFETLLKRFELRDPALRRLGEMIHDTDLEDGKFQRNECVGLELVFKGWARMGHSDAEILEKGFACFDALVAWLRKRS